jgi:glycosyltransferase involved in cell wall biosynthesis
VLKLKILDKRIFKKQINNMKKTPILSICIPTFQREKVLEKTLQSIIDSEKLAHEKIEICISDNASKDGTFKMLKDYAKKYSFIHIRKNNKNLGFDSNLAASLKMAHGKYCWANGDDDPVSPSGIKKFVILLEERGPFIMGLSGIKTDKRFQKQEYDSEEFINRLVSVIQDSSKFFRYRQDSCFLGSISAYFFSYDTLKKSFKILGGKRGGWYHFAVLFQIISNFKGNILVNKEPIQSKKTGLSRTLYLPREEFNLFVEQRIQSLSNIKINNKLRKAFHYWLNLRGNYIYIKSLVQLFMVSEMIDKENYNSLKNRVYECEKKIKKPLLSSFIVLILKTFEPSIAFRRTISFCYKKTRPNYFNLMKDYIKGNLNTASERDGTFLS